MNVDQLVLFTCGLIISLYLHSLFYSWTYNSFLCIKLSLLVSVVLYFSSVQLLLLCYLLYSWFYLPSCCSSVAIVLSFIVSIQAKRPEITMNDNTIATELQTTGQIEP